MPATVDSLFRLDNQVAIVTGGAGRLGSQYAGALTSAGAAVALFDLAAEPRASVAALMTRGLPISFHTLDLTNRDAVFREVGKVVQHFGPPTVLVNNAGLGARPDAPASENGPFEEYPESSWDVMMNSHLKTAFFTSQAFITQFNWANSSRSESLLAGSIINVSSTYGVVSPDQSVYEFRRDGGAQYYKPVGYSVAKSGVLNFTRWLAEYCAPLNIRVNTLVPGGVREEGDAPEFIAEYEKRTPMGRMACDSDYNGAVVFLASSASAYMTGATLVVDGGWTAR